MVKHTLINFKLLLFNKAVRKEEGELGGAGMIKEALHLPCRADNMSVRKQGDGFSYIRLKIKMQ